MSYYKFAKQNFEYTGDGSIESVQEFCKNKRDYEQSRVNFINEHSGLNYYEDDNAIYMLQPFEKVIDGEIKGLETDPEYIASQLEKAKTSTYYNIISKYDQAIK